MWFEIKRLLCTNKLITITCLRPCGIYGAAFLGWRHLHVTSTKECCCCPRPLEKTFNNFQTCMLCVVICRCNKNACYASNAWHAGLTIVVRPSKLLRKLESSTLEVEGFCRTSCPADSLAAVFEIYVFKFSLQTQFLFWIEMFSSRLSFRQVDYSRDHRCHSSSLKFLLCRITIILMRTQKVKRNPLLDYVMLTVSQFNKSLQNFCSNTVCTVSMACDSIAHYTLYVKTSL